MIPAAADTEEPADGKPRASGDDPEEFELYEREGK